MWQDEYNDENPLCGSILWAPSGGVVLGIASDSPCRPFIDCAGFIHTPNKDWTTNHLVNCSQSKLFQWDGSGIFAWRPPVKKDAYQCLERSGKISGRIQSLELDNIRTSATAQPQGSVHYLLSEAGEVRNGDIGIGVAVFDPSYRWWNGGEPQDITCCGTVYYAWNNGGGLIRGIMADISLNEAHTKAPYIDCHGIIHVVYVDWKAVQCEEFDRKIPYASPTQYTPQS